MIQIDGSQGEGGGQIVRTAMALSTLIQKPFQIINIRSGRPNPGLKAQHLHAIKALKQICQAETNQVTLGSTTLTFTPKKIKKGTFEIDIGTAGSITLLLQALILPCMFAPGKTILKIKGGTSGKWQASVDYLQNLLLPHLRKFVKIIDLKILKRGYYPKGGGEIELEISPKLKLNDFENFQEFWNQLIKTTPEINLTQQGDLEQIKGIINCSKSLEEPKVAERIKESAKSELKKLNCPLNLNIEYSETLSPGGEIVLWAKFSQHGEINFQNPVVLGADTIAEKGKSSEQVGQQAAQELIKEINSPACVDKHLADQLLPFLALLPNSQIKTSQITNHTKTNLQIIKQFLPIKFEIKGNEISVSERQII